MDQIRLVKPTLAKLGEFLSSRNAYFEYVGPLSSPSQQDVGVLGAQGLPIDFLSPAQNREPNWPQKQSPGWSHLQVGQGAPGKGQPGMAPDAAEPKGEASGPHREAANCRGQKIRVLI